LSEVYLSRDGRNAGPNCTDARRKDRFVEVKAPGKKPRKLQIRRHGVLRHLGFPVFILDDPKQIPGIIHGIEGGTGWET
jgi:hypothetical protein